MTIKMCALFRIVYVIMPGIIHLCNQVEGYSCTPAPTPAYSTLNTNAVLRFDISAFLNPSNTITYNIRFHDGTVLGNLRYKSNGEIIKQVLSGYGVTANTAGIVELTVLTVVEDSKGIYYIGGGGSLQRCSCLYILDIPTKPTISVTENPSVGGSTTFTCSSTSTTTPSNHSLSNRFNWKVNNADNPSGSRYSYSTKRRTLTLSNLAKNDVYKQFTCTATEDVTDGYTSSSSDSVTLDIHYGPDTANFNVTSPYHIKEGDSNINIECSSDCNPGCSYSWTNLTSGTRISTNGVLSLGTVNRYMAGDYRCVSSNTAAHLLTKSSTITTIVKYAPDVSVRLSNTNTREGETLTLFCDGVGVPPTNSYISLSQSWNNIEIPNSNKALSGTQQYNSIHFSSLKLEDTGTYTCVLNNGVRNIFGELNQLSSRTILVEVRPKVLTDELRFTGSTGGTARVHISIYSYPALTDLTVTKYDGTRVSSGTYNISEQMVKTAFYGKSVLLNGSTFDLVMDNLKENDFGSYTLKLSNRIGTTDINAFIIAEGRPSPPKIFRYLSDYSIPTFVWEKNFNGGKIQSFVIQLSTAGTELWIDYTNILENDEHYQISSTIYMATISGLQPETYSARIFSNNSIGDSETVDLGTTFEVVRQTDNCRVDEDKTGLIVGICLAILSAVLTVYSTFITIVLKRKTSHTGTQSQKQPTEQATYLNLVEGVASENTNCSRGNDVKPIELYTDLARKSMDDKTTYDVIQRI